MKPIDASNFRSILPSRDSTEGRSDGAGIPAHEAAKIEEFARASRADQNTNVHPAIGHLDDLAVLHDLVPKWRALDDRRNCGA